MRDKLKFIWSGLWEFLQPLIFTLMTRAGLALVAAAKEAVVTVEKSMPEAKGPDKMKAAFQIVANIMAIEGYKLATSTINSALEAAVVWMKAQGK